jgi:hypothetical protein
MRVSVSPSICSGEGGGHGDSLLFSPIFLDSEVDHGAGLTEHSIESRENYLRDKSGEEDNERGGDSDKT